MSTSPWQWRKKNPVAESAPPAKEPVPIFEDGYAKAASGSAPKPANGVNLYWYREKSAAESGGQSAMTPEADAVRNGRIQFCSTTFRRRRGERL